MINDAVPLFHHRPEAPLLETAFLLVGGQGPQLKIDLIV